MPASSSRTTGKPSRSTFRPPQAVSGQARASYGPIRIHVSWRLLVADRTVSVYESGEADRLPAHDHEVYSAIAQDSSFVELRRRYRRFAFPATIAFTVWYITYVICANWARDF